MVLEYCTRLTNPCNTKCGTVDHLLTTQQKVVHSGMIIPDHRLPPLRSAKRQQRRIERCQTSEAVLFFLDDQHAPNICEVNERTIAHAKTFI